jgi:UDP-glucose:(heptosyl)LPS alpha-1,3-glucosyltransferase
MEIALCYETVVPARGGCEHYISALARRLARDGHAVHLYAAQWDAEALPETIHYHRMPRPTGPRFLRPWRFAESCEQALSHARHDISMGFDKTWGQDILYPQGGLHSASAEHNLLKYPNRFTRFAARVVKGLDFAHRSFRKLERKQYLGEKRPLILVNSRMVQRHFEEYLDIPAEEITVLPSAIDPDRFLTDDRLKRRAEERDRWGVTESDPVGLMVAMNYRLKGLSPLIQSLRWLPTDSKFRLVVVGNARYRSYERLAQRLKVSDRIRFLGFRAEPRDQFFGADFLVHPTFYDPCSLVALEALACGLPVITTQYNGASERFEPGKEGLVVRDPHDGHELAAAIQTLCEPETLSSFTRAAKVAGRRWTFEDHYQQLLTVFRRVQSVKRAA